MGGHIPLGGYPDDISSSLRPANLGFVLCTHVQRSVWEWALLSLSVLGNFRSSRIKYFIFEIQLYFGSVSLGIGLFFCGLGFITISVSDVVMRIKCAIYI